VIEVIKITKFDRERGMITKKTDESYGLRMRQEGGGEYLHYFYGGQYD
jgi:hypothetical protein